MVAVQLGISCFGHCWADGQEFLIYNVAVSFLFCKAKRWCFNHRWSHWRTSVCSLQGSMNSWNRSARHYQIWCRGPRQDTMFVSSPGSRVCVGTKFWQFSKQGLFEQILEPLDTWFDSFELTSCPLQKIRPTKSRTKQSESPHSWKQSGLSTQSPTVVERYDDFSTDAIYFLLPRTLRS